MPVQGAGESIRAAVLAWTGVSAHPHQFGGTEYRIGNREIGHIHGDDLVDIPLPTRVRDELVAAGRAEPHHILPNSGWITFRLHQPDDVAAAIELFRLSYDAAVRQGGPRPAGDQA